MSLGSGTRLGPYEIAAAIGAGGMGEVYRATDTRLKRDVALKILPESFATDPDRLARFQREAEVLASLSHPYIAGIHGLEISDGIRALVMELVDGETLADRIARGPIPFEDALPIARQVAEALEAAHERGIVHRDLKPANIKLRSDGTVKVLDFGLAKALDPDSSAIDRSLSPTITSPAMMTGVGVLLGTAAYMSPEQAAGKPADRRSDLWAFGVVLLEMLTGRPVFTGETVSHVLASVLKTEPDWTLLPRDTPAPIRRLLRRCLQKDRSRRLQSAGDARLEIDEVRSEPDAPSSPPSRVAGPLRERIVWSAVTSLVTAVVAIGIMLNLRPAAPEPLVTRLDVVTPQTSDPFSFALSRDGRQLAFVATADGASRLWVRPLDQATARSLSGTAGASYPFWSPDGNSIGFFADGKLKRIDVATGVVQELTDVPGARGGTWNREGVIVFAPQQAGLMRIAATGGTPTVLTHLAAGQGTHRWPQFLPDGRRFLFFVGLGQPSTHGIYLGSLDGGEPTRVLAGETAGFYTPPGYLLHVVQGVLVAQRFDAERAVVSPESVPIAQLVGTDDGTFHSAFSVSDAGILVHRPGALVQRQLVWVDRAGAVTGVVSKPDDAALAGPELAPDGQRVTVVRFVQGNFDTWIIEVARASAARFTFDAANEGIGLWSPNGSRIVFASARNGRWDLFEKPANGADDEQPLLVTAQDKIPLDWSPDGRVLLYALGDPKTGSDLWALPLTGDRKPFAVVQTRFDEREGQFSPDGRWMAYVSSETGRDEVYIRPFPGPGSRWQISITGGIDPRWRRDGRELFYVAPDGKLMAAPIQIGADKSTLSPGSPVALFPTRFPTGANVTIGFLSHPQYAVARDGRFLMNVTVDEPNASPIIIVQNWMAGLKK